MKKFIGFLLSGILLFSLAACSSEAAVTATAAASDTQSAAVVVSAGATGVADTTVSDAGDTSTDPEDLNVVEIVLGDTIEVSGGTGVEVSGSVVTITAAGTYNFYGELTDGQINVNTTEKVKIKLHDVSITNSSGPALLVTDAKKVTLTVVEGTVNYLTDAANTSEYDAAIFTNDTLVIKGKGTLYVTGNNVEGISSDDDIIIENGNIYVTAPDDGLNAHDDITISGGYLYVVAGGDGVDSNGTVNLTGGMVISLGSANMGDGGVDAVSTFTITGGTLIATGNSVAAPNSASTQSSVYVNTGSTQAAGTLIHIEQDGAEILTYAPASTYQTLLYSSPALTEGAAYQVSLGGSSDGTAQDGVYSSGTYSGGTSLSSVTAALVPANIETMGGGAGGRGGARP